MAYGKLDLGPWQIYLPGVKTFDLACLGGRPPQQQWLKNLIRSCPGQLWAADSGLELFKDVNICPSRIIGDFDSLTASYLLERARKSGAEILCFPTKKELTDFQLLLLAWGKNKTRSDRLVVTGFWGGRFDHLWCNVRSLSWAMNHRLPAPLACDERQLLILLKGGEEVTVDFNYPPYAVSLLPLTPLCEGVQTEGLYWRPDNRLSNDLPYAISNKTTERPFKVSLQKGRLGLYVTAPDLNEQG